MYGVGRVLNVNKPCISDLTRKLAQLHANACMGHVLQSSLVPRLLKAGTEALSELEVTKCTAVCYLFRSVLCLISDG